MTKITEPKTPTVTIDSYSGQVLANEKPIDPNESYKFNNNIELIVKFLNQTGNFIFWNSSQGCINKPFKAYNIHFSFLNLQAINSLATILSVYYRWMDYTKITIDEIFLTQDQVINNISRFCPLPNGQNIIEYFMNKGTKILIPGDDINHDNDLTTIDRKYIRNTSVFESLYPKNETTLIDRRAYMRNIQEASTKSSFNLYVDSTNLSKVEASFDNLRRDGMEDNYLYLGGIESSEQLSITRVVQIIDSVNILDLGANSIILRGGISVVNEINDLVKLTTSLTKIAKESRLKKNFKINIVGLNISQINIIKDIIKMCDITLSMNILGTVFLGTANELLALEGDASGFDFNINGSDNNLTDLNTLITRTRTNINDPSSEQLDRILLVDDFAIKVTPADFMSTDITFNSVINKLDSLSDNSIIINIGLDQTVESYLKLVPGGTGPIGYTITGSIKDTADNISIMSNSISRWDSNSLKFIVTKDDWINVQDLPKIIELVKDDVEFFFPPIKGTSDYIMSSIGINSIHRAMQLTASNRPLGLIVTNNITITILNNLKNIKLDVDGGFDRLIGKIQNDTPVVITLDDMRYDRITSGRRIHGSTNTLDNITYDTTSFPPTFNMEQAAQIFKSTSNQETMSMIISGTSNNIKNNVAFFKASSAGIKYFTITDSMNTGTIQSSINNINAIKESNSSFKINLVNRITDIYAVISSLKTNSLDIVGITVKNTITTDEALNLLSLTIGNIKLEGGVTDTCLHILNGSDNVVIRDPTLNIYLLDQCKLELALEIVNDLQNLKHTGSIFFKEGVLITDSIAYVDKLVEVVPEINYYMGYTKVVLVNAMSEFIKNTSSTLVANIISTSEILETLNYIDISKILLTITVEGDINLDVLTNLIRKTNSIITLKGDILITTPTNLDTIYANKDKFTGPTGVKVEIPLLTTALALKIMSIYNNSNYTNGLVDSYANLMSRDYGINTVLSKLCNNRTDIIDLRITDSSISVVQLNTIISTIGSNRGKITAKLTDTSLNMVDSRSNTDDIITIEVTTKSSISNAIKILGKTNDNSTLTFNMGVEYQTTTGDNFVTPKIEGTVRKTILEKLKLMTEDNVIDYALTYNSEVTFSEIKTIFDFTTSKNISFMGGVRDKLENFTPREQDAEYWNEINANTSITKITLESLTDISDEQVTNLNSLRANFIGEISTVVSGQSGIISRIQSVDSNTTNSVNIFSITLTDRASFKETLRIIKISPATSVGFSKEIGSDGIEVDEYDVFSVKKSQFATLDINDTTIYIDLYDTNLTETQVLELNEINIGLIGRNSGVIIRLKAKGVYDIVKHLAFNNTPGSMTAIRPNPQAITIVGGNSTTPVYNTIQDFISKKYEYNVESHVVLQDTMSNVVNDLNNFKCLYSYPTTELTAEVPLSIEEAMGIAISRGFTLGGGDNGIGGTFDFVGNYPVKGLYTYSYGELCGKAYFGTGGTNEEMTTNIMSIPNNRRISNAKNHPHTFIKISLTDIITESDYAGITTLMRHVSSPFDFKLELTNSSQFLSNDFTNMITDKIQIFFVSLNVLGITDDSVFNLLELLVKFNGFNIKNATFDLSQSPEKIPLLNAFIVNNRSALMDKFTYIEIKLGDITDIMVEIKELAVNIKSIITRLDYQNSIELTFMCNISTTSHIINYKAKEHQSGEMRGAVYTFTDNISILDINTLKSYTNNNIWINPDKQIFGTYGDFFKENMEPQDNWKYVLANVRILGGLAPGDFDIRIDDNNITIDKALNYISGKYDTSNFLGKIKFNEGIRDTYANYFDGASVDENHAGVSIKIETILNSLASNSVIEVIGEINNVKCLDISRINMLRKCTTKNGERDDIILKLFMSGRSEILRDLELSPASTGSSSINDYTIVVENIPKGTDASTIKSKTKNNLQYRQFKTDSNLLPMVPTIIPTEICNIVNDIRYDWEKRESNKLDVHKNTDVDDCPTGYSAANAGYIEDPLIRELNFYKYALNKMKAQLETSLNNISSNAESSEADKELVYAKRNELKTIYKASYKKYRENWRNASTQSKFGWK